MDDMSEPDPPSAGEPSIPGYTLSRLLGSGSSGQVYEGVRQATGEAVAVKVLTRAFDPRFAREVAILQALDHPHILRIVDHGSSEGQAFLATELVRGPSLHDVLLLRALGPAALTQLVAKLGQAVGAAHAQGVLHRDVKPANVLLDEAMAPRLVDFGLAAFADDSGSLTRAGTALGTPMYMAPEVLAGGSSCATEKSDVYALGVILYEGLSAKHPFQGPDWPTTRERILSGEPAPLHGAADWLQAVCLRALARDPQQRPTANAFAEALLACDPSAAEAAAPAPSAPALGAGRWAVGDELGAYRLEAVLGQGAMGTVFLGRHQTTQVRHALKLVSAARPDLIERFKSEALALAKVGDHPGVVAIHQFVTLESGESFFALDYVPGNDLEHALRQGPLAIDRALTIAQQLAEALAHVHAHGIVHRDLKPANVLLHGDDGRTLLADFGLALDPEAQRLTASNAILGTPCYMAPEQAHGARADVGPKADVFSLGAVLYTLLVGTPPFQRAHFVDLLVALLQTEPTPPRRLRDEISPGLERLVLWCLEKDPTERPDAAELAQALAALRRGEGFTRSRPSGPRRRAGARRLAVLVGFSLLAVASGAAVVAVAARAQNQAAWEGLAHAAIEAAEFALTRADQQSVVAFYDWTPTASPPDAQAHEPSLLKSVDWLALRGDPETMARLASKAGPEALERLAQDGAGPLASKLEQRATALRAARVRAQIHASLRTDPHAAQPLLAKLPAMEQAAYGALVQFRLGTPTDPARLLSLAEQSTPKLADRLRLLAARVELERGGLAAARELAAASPYGRAGAWLTAEAHVREALAAAADLDTDATLRALDEAAAHDPQRAKSGVPRVAAVALAAWKGGAVPQALLPLLDALNGPEGRAPQTAPIYMAAATDVSSTGGAAAAPECAQLLERALRLDPRVAAPYELQLWLSLQAGRYAASGDFVRALPLFFACTRSGMVLSPPQLQLSTTAAIYRSQALREALRADPSNWPAIAWRGMGAYAIWRVEGEAKVPAKQGTFAKRALDDFTRCLAEPAVRGELRAEFELLQLSCLQVHGREALREQLEALEARGDFPELWRAYRLATLAFQGADPELQLRYARGYVDELTRRIAATTAGRLAPGQRGADGQRLSPAYLALIRSLVRAGKRSEAQSWYERDEVRDTLSPQDARQITRLLEAR